MTNPPEPTEAEMAEARAFWATMPRAAEVVRNLARDPLHYDRLAQARAADLRAKATRQRQ